MGAAPPITAKSWFRRFCEVYDTSAADPPSDLGVFYDRHRSMALHESPTGGPLVEYTNAEWTQILSVFFARLAREFRLYQTWEWNGRPELAWTRPGPDWHLVALIGEVNEGDDSVVGETVPALLAAQPDISVLLMYPDYPTPLGAATLDEARGVWEKRIARALGDTPVAGEFLLVTLSTNSWEVPAPWQASEWDPAARTFHPALRG